MSADIKKQVVAAIKERGKFSLQLDESTDVRDDAQLLVYARYQGKSDMEENFLFCKRLETTTTGNQMCSDMGSEYEHLLYYSAVRWLSRGKVLQRVFEMRTQVEIFLNEKKHALASRLSEPRWLLQLAYLADIFSELNLLNMSMHGRDETYLTLSEKLKAFKAKLRLWKGKIEREKAAFFPLLNLFLEDEEDVSLLDIQNIIVEHLEKLSDEFDRYIPDEELHEKYKWVRRPFNVQVEDLSEEESSI
ncbi:zinc finger BED domain-containing protein 5-like [Homarus americanus]|nr:zinc finger BED domain-containing protein 5-like [Homarus americanus]